MSSTQHAQPQFVCLDGTRTIVVLDQLKCGLAHAAANCGSLDGRLALLYPPQHVKRSSIGDNDQISTLDRGMPWPSPAGEAPRARGEGRAGNGRIDKGEQN